MKKILVPTDFSWNSKAGIRFAIQWASQQKLELVFVHVITVVQPTRWNEGNFKMFLQNESKIILPRMKAFIKEIYGHMEKTPGKHSFIVLNGPDVDLAIMEYCHHRKDINAICISTHGASGIKKIFGTNTGNLVTKSDIPVFAIPKTYKPHRITSVMFASDMRQLRTELKTVLGFAKPLGARIEILHLSWLDDLLPGHQLIGEMLRARYDYKIKVEFVQQDLGKTWLRNMQEQVNARRPSVLIIFTDKNKSALQKLFGGSKAEQLSFRLKVPMLVFSKPIRGSKQATASTTGLSHTRI